MISLIKESLTNVGIRVAGEMTRAGISGLSLSEGEGWKDQFVDWLKHIQAMYETIPPEQREDITNVAGLVLTGSIGLLFFGPLLYALGSDINLDREKRK